MNEISRFVANGLQSSAHRGGFASSYELSVLVRYRRFVLLCAAICGALAMSYALLRAPNYAATAKVLVGAQDLQLVQSSIADASIAISMADSQVEVLSSDDIALTVIHGLKLQNDKSFNKASLLELVVARVRRLLSKRSIAGDPLLGVLRAFKGKLVVKRLGTSNVIDVTFHSEDANQAAEIANAVARTYLDFNLNANSQSLQQASAWLLNRVDELRQQVATADQALQNARTDLSTLREQTQVQNLEATATSYRQLYDAFLQRYMQWVESASFPVSTSSIVSHATPPIVRAGPRGYLLLGGGIVAGLILGVIWAFVRDLSDTKIRTESDAAATTAAPCLGVLPRVRVRASGGLSRAVGSYPARLFGIVLLPDLGCGNNAQARTLEAVVLRMRKPGAEKVGFVAGVTSIDVGEGKTTTAINLARLLHATRRRTLLIDVNLYNPTLSVGVGQWHGRGLLSCLEGRLSLREAVFVEPETGLSILPTGHPREQGAFLSALIWGERMSDFITEARSTFDYIIFDLPCTTVSADAQKASDFIDGFLLVITSAQSDMRAVQQLMSKTSWLRQKLLGSVLNRCDLARLKRVAYPDLQI
jgi:Mrp family chromosome partitioning ATPase/capsular polysaccharide biosynthesis protein